MSCTPNSELVVDNVDPNAVNADNAGLSGTYESDPVNGCALFEVWDGSTCVLPDRRVTFLAAATRGLPDGLGSPSACFEVLQDAEVARSFRASKDVREETTECLVTSRRDQPLPTGYAFAAPDLGAVAVTTDAGIVPLSDRDPAGCVFNAEASALAFGQSFELTIDGGETLARTTATLQMPGDPQASCDDLVPGAPFEFRWTPTGADQVFVELEVDGDEIRCRVPDSGSYTVSAALTSLLPEPANLYIRDVSALNQARSFDESTGVWLLSTAQAWFSCE